MSMSAKALEAALAMNNTIVLAWFGQMSCLLWNGQTPVTQTVTTLPE